MKSRLSGEEVRRGLIEAVAITVILFVVFYAVSLLVGARENVGVSLKPYVTADVTYADGETSHVDGTYFGSVSKGDVVTLHVTLPNSLKVSRGALCFAIYHSVTQVTYDGTVLESYGEDIEARGDLIGLHQYCVSIPDEAWGNQITITLKPTEDDAFSRLYILNVYPEKDAFNYTWDNYFLTFWTGVPLFVVSLAMFILVCFMKVVNKYDGFCIAAFICLLSLYMLTTGVLPLLGFTQYFWQQANFILVYLVSYPMFLLVIHEEINRRSRIAMFVLFVFEIVFFVVATVLNFTNVLHYPALLTVSHVITGFNAVLLLLFAIKRAMSGRRSGHYYLVGICALFASGMFELLRANVPALVVQEVPSILPVGVLVFSVMLIISYLSSIGESAAEAALKEARLEQRASRDSMTGLYNHSTAEGMMQNFVSSAGPDTRAALIVLDIDDFKQVNDTYGHPFGDEIIVEIAKVVQGCFRSSDIVGRLGGDEMMIMMCDTAGTEAVMNKIEYTESELSAALKTKTERGEISCSMGCALFPQDAQDFDDLYKSADTALYEAKTHGKGRAVMYKAEQQPREGAHPTL